MHQTHKKVLKKCQSPWNAQNTSTVKCDFLRNKLNKTPTVTRWNSLFDSIRELLHIYDTQSVNLNSVLQYFQISVLTPDEIAYLKSYTTAMEPVAVGLDVIQGETDIYCGVTIPLLLKTIKKLDSLIVNNARNVQVVILSKILVSSIKKTFIQYNKK